MSGLAASSRLGISAFNETPRVELRPNWTGEDVETVVQAVYRQLLGNDYIMESQRLIFPESQLRQGNITVRDFVRAIAKSELYKSKFFHSNFQSRFTELNYKHLLGRAPFDESEIAFHNDLYSEKGYDADIDSYIDSEEYTASFGDFVVPFYRGFGYFTGARTVGFNRMFRLYRGYASSDRSQVGGKAARLTQDLALNKANRIVSPSGGSGGSSASVDGTFGARPSSGGTGDEASRLYRVEVTSIRAPGYPAVRRSKAVYVVPYSQLSAKLQQVQRKGGKVTGVAPV